MPDISNINTIDADSIDQLSAVAKSNIASFTGISLPSGAAPPLDVYTGAAAGYSVRLLRTAYAGSCIEAYRDSDGATQDIGFVDGLIDTASIISFASGSVVRVQTWYDQSTNGLDASEATPSQMPVIYDGASISTLGSHPALSYTQADSTQLSTASSTLWTDGNAMWVSLFARSGVATGSQSLWDLETGDNITRHGWNTNADEFHLWYGTPTSAAPGGPNTVGQYLATGLFDGTDAYLYSNDTLIEALPASPVSTPATTAAYIGSRLGSQSWPSALVQEIIHYGFDNSSQRTNLASNINSHYQFANLPDYTSGFLADYPGATVAYSVRALSNRAFRALRVRRDAAPFDELDIGFDGNGDLDTAAVSAFGGSDVLRVSGWYDQSGNQIDATQAAGASQPEIYDGAAVLTNNGKPCVEFVRTGSVTGTGLVTPSSVSWSTSGDLEFFMVFDNGGLVGNQETWSNAACRFFAGSANHRVNTTAGALVYTLSEVTNQNLFVYEHNPTARTIYIDGVQDVTSASPASASTTSSVGALGQRYNAVEGHADMLFQELIHYPTNQSSNRTAIETDVNTYFSIY